jgi:hypothetical protein
MRRRSTLPRGVQSAENASRSLILHQPANQVAFHPLWMYPVPLSLLLLCQLLLVDTVQAAQQCRLVLGAKVSGGGDGASPAPTSTSAGSTPAATGAGASGTSTSTTASSSATPTPFKYGTTPIRGVNLYVSLPRVGVGETETVRRGSWFLLEARRSLLPRPVHY